MTAILNNAARLVAFIRPGSVSAASGTEPSAGAEAMAGYRLRDEYTAIFEKELRQSFVGQRENAGR